MKYPFTVQRYFEVPQLTQARIYLASKRMSTFSIASGEIEDLSTQPIPLSLSKTNPQRQDDRGRLWRQKYPAVDIKEKKEYKVEILDNKEDKDKCLWQEIKDVQRLEALRKMRENRVPPEPAENTEQVKVLVNNSVEGNVWFFSRWREHGCCIRLGGITEFVCREFYIVLTTRKVHGFHVRCCLG